MMSLIHEIEKCQTSKKEKKKPKNQKVKVWLSGDGDGEISLETCNKY